MNRTELIMRRRNVSAFIEADPVYVEFNREAEPTRTAAGGWVRGESDTPIPRQQVRIVQNKRRYNNGLINSEAGEIPHNVDYLLIGRYTLNIEVEDDFEWFGEHYHVTGIYGLRTESVLASIDFLGPENRNV